MAINFNTGPYYDDFDETKGFHRILFRPGYAVQARELTQLQTQIQNQIRRFGDSIYKNNSIVLPGNPVYDPNYKAVKLEATYSGTAADTVLATLVDQIVVGQSTGMRAKVVNYKASEGSDPPTLYIKYLNSGSNGITSTFADGEVIVNAADTISVQAISSAATSVGSAFSISSGIAYTRGAFVYFEDQTLILEKYGSVDDIIIGFNVDETIVTSDDDTTLLDPANGSYNYTAPGADRWKIALTLDTRTFTPTSLDDPDFIELIRIQGGRIISQTTSAQYAVLGDTLARRTFDESGDYVVKPYNISMFEHLRTGDPTLTSTAKDGIYFANTGGDADKMVAQLTPGKAYVKGYEIQNLLSTSVEVDKARDFNTVTLGTVAIPFGNYVVVNNITSLPDLASLPSVTLYDQYNATGGTGNGNVVGTARIRHIEYSSGTVGVSTAQYKVYLFDIVMNAGKSFTNDVKQLYSAKSGTPQNFTADVVTSGTLLTGTISLDSTTTAIAGVGTRFTTQLKVNDYISVDTQKLRVTAITDARNLTVASAPSSNVSGTIYNVERATVEDITKKNYLFKMPADVIKTVDASGANTIYSARRGYTRTLSSGATTITAGTDETFSSFSDDNYMLTLQSGANNGLIIDLDGFVTRGGSPTGKSLTVDISGLGYTTEDVYIVTTLAKTGSAGDKKVKTLVEDAYVDFTTQAAAEAAVLSLGKADIYKLKGIRLSTANWGASYSNTASVDITDRYTFDNGQRLTHYDVGTATLKAGQPKPTNPIRIMFDYFTHGAGDFFTVESYPDLDYKDIPTVTFDGVDYPLRDYMDFRPKINDAGTGYTGTGSSVGEFPDFENDLVTSYQYYLPRTDKIVLDKTGKVYTKYGKSEIGPREPSTPTDAMALYVLRQQPYVFDVIKDVEIFPVDNSRYTMRDIGKLETRIKNLEYYTTLTLLELETQQFQVKDSDGFDRFKNGFVVDSFKGHGIGDVYNSDYGVAIDSDKYEVRPVVLFEQFDAEEINTTDVARAADGYLKRGDLITLAIDSEEAFITSGKSSKTVNLNPFNVASFVGTVNLFPSTDNWYEINREPTVYNDVEGNYESVLADARAKGKFGTVWGSWRVSNETTNTITEEKVGTVYKVEEVIDTTVNKDKVVSTKLLPKMRDTRIGFVAEGLKPSTRLYFFFDNINVTRDVVPTSESTAFDSANTSGFWPEFDPAYIQTDDTGKANGTFYYSESKYGLSTGTHVFRISDSNSGNINAQESMAQAAFAAFGQQRNVVDEVTSVRNAVLSPETVYEYKTTDKPEPVVEIITPEPTIVEQTPLPDPYQEDFIDMIYLYAFDRMPDAAGKAYWTGVAAARGINTALIRSVYTERWNPDIMINHPNAGGPSGDTALLAYHRPRTTWATIPTAADFGTTIGLGISWNQAAETIHGFVTDIVWSGYYDHNETSETRRAYYARWRILSAANRTMPQAYDRGTDGEKPFFFFAADGIGVQVAQAMDSERRIAAGTPPTSIYPTSTGPRWQALTRKAYNNGIR